MPTKIQTETVSHVVHYPQAQEASIQQMAVFWSAEELGVERDEQDFRTSLTEGEKHGVLTLQRTLTHLERIIGGDSMWGGRIPKLFPRPEIMRMASVFAMMELNSHAPFYRIGNEVIGYADDAFYEEWEHIPALKQHTDYIIKMSQSDDPLEATASLTFLEGVVLFSAFAYFKSFNTRGFNLIPHFVSGIDASAKDENFHAQASAWLFNQCLTEKIQAKELTAKQASEKYKQVIYQLAQDTYQHECNIIDLIFSHKPETIRTCTKEELQHFVRDRVNFVLSLFGLEPLFNQAKGIVSEWFYENLSKYKHSDFFATTQVQYVRNWDMSKINFKSELIHDYQS